MIKLSQTLSALATLGLLTSGAQGALTYDANVTPDVIFGSGNTNGSFTINDDAATSGIELALRGKLRHNAAGLPENTFNSNGDGTYTFNPGVAPTQSFPTAEWSFEWSINSNIGGLGGNLDTLTYSLTIAGQPAFDPINVAYADHSIGNNSTLNDAGVEAPSGDTAAYAALIAGNNVAQNSWKPSWFIPLFDPTAPGDYVISLSAYNSSSVEVASTSITINVVPEPSIVLFGLTALGLGALMLRRRR